MELPCIQSNLRKSALATSLLSHELSLKPRIGFVTEPHTAFKKVVGKPMEYNVYPEIVCEEAPRAALYIPRSVKNVGLPHLSNPDCQAALLYLQTSIILIASVYLDINLTPTPAWLRELSEFAETKRYGILIAMDSNSHSTLFGPTENDRGRQLEQFILGANFWVENRGITPTFQTLQAESFIDITITREVRVLNWRVSSAYNASDHNTILFLLDQVVSVPPRDVRPWKQADWGQFSQILRRPGYDIPARITCKKLDKMVSHLYYRIEEALDVSCPKISSPVKFKGSKWFSKSLSNDSLKVRKQFNIAKRVETREEWDKYHVMHKKFKHKCRKAKTSAWRHYVTDTENEHLMSKLAKVAQHRDRAQLHTLRKSDGTFSEPGVDTLCELSRAHFPAASQDLPHAVYDSSRILCKEDIKQMYPDFLTVHKVKASLGKFHPYKAPGPDGLKAVVFQHFPDVVFEYIWAIYVACIYLRYTPRLWQQSSVVFLPKPGKPNYVLGKYFRPIVLSNNFLKGLERIFTWRMDALLQYYPIHERQHGFTKGRSTESAISNTVDYIERCLFRRQYCIGVFLDISSAYDSISIQHIRESLYKHGADVDLVEWYYHYLSNRILHLSLHGESLHLHTAVGFPQGGVASAKFWLLAFDPAIQIINSMFVEGNGYADDCCIVFGGRKPEILVARIQRVINKLLEWGSTCGLRFNPEKTIVVNFSRKKQRLIPHIRIGNEYVPYSREALYLGIILDDKLTWRRHLNHKIAKSKKYLMKMSNISKAIWGPKPKLSRWVFRCVVRPMFTYASVIWAHSIDSDALRLIVRRVNRLALATYTLFPKSTPTQGVELLTDTFPLHLWLEKEALCSFVRLASLLPLTWSGTNKNKRRNIAHRRFWWLKIEEYGLEGLLLEIDSCYTLTPPLSFEVLSASFHDAAFYLDFLNVSKWQIWSDGSKQGKKVGAAFVIYKDNTLWVSRKFRLPDTASVFQAELFAIYQAALYLCTSEMLSLDDECFFFTDSQSTLQSVLATETRTSLVRRLIQQLNTLAEQLKRVALLWVKAHCGIVGNEKADLLAKEALLLTNITYTPLPRSQIKKQVIEHLRLRWKDEWERYDEARHTKIFISSSDRSRGKVVCSLNRVDLRRLIMCITNHNNLFYHQSLHDDTINPTCRFCRLFDETFDHFFTCPFFHQARCEWGIVWPYSDDSPWQPLRLMEFVNNTDIKAALDRRTLTPIRISEDDADSVSIQSPIQTPFTIRIFEEDVDSPDSDISMISAWSDLDQF